MQLEEKKEEFMFWLKGRKHLTKVEKEKYYF
jgi:hypothetical protein